MTDSLEQMLVSNLLVSALLAVAATSIGWRGRNNRISHAAWILVFVKLVTPPILTLPIISSAAIPVSFLGSSGALEAHSMVSGPQAFNLLNLLVVVALSGSATVLTVSAIRVIRFNRLLGREAHSAGRLDLITQRLAPRFGLANVPRVLTTRAGIAPLVWSVGRDVRIVVPIALAEGMKRDELEWILAHELAHVRRRDYLIRWIEWVVTVLFWWNPVVWWARHEIRVHEELCCDALVLSCLRVGNRKYAESLFSAIELLARPQIRPLALASEMNSGGIHERRFKMILKGGLKHSTSKWIAATAVICTVLVLPLGFGCQDGSTLTGNDSAVSAENLRSDLEVWLSNTDDLSGEERKAQAVRLRKRIEEAVASGAIEKQDAAELSTVIGVRTEGGTVGVLLKKAPAEKFEAVARKLEEEVASGRLTPIEAKKKLGEVREYVVQGVPLSDGSGNVMRRMNPDDAARKELQAAIESGQLAPLEAREKRSVLKRRDGSNNK